MSDRDEDLVGRARDEITAMAKQGMGHPSTKPVLIGAGIGAVAGALLPVITLPAGLAIGAGIVFWQRIKR
jgi:hypothetical protein